MGKIKSVKFNFIMNFILTASNFIFPLITFPYVSRILLASGNGKIAFVTSVANYFTMIASLGIPTYGIRACASIRDDKEKLSKTVQELIIIHSFITILSLIFYFLSIFVIDKFYAEKELMIINGIGLFLNVLGVNWLYSALEQYEYITLRSIAFKILSVVLMFLLVHQKEDYILYGAISVFAAAGSNLLNFINLKKYIYFKKYKNYEFKKHMKPILIFFAQTVAITVYTNLDNVMLGFMKGDTQVGLYSASVRLKTMLVSLVTSLGTVLMPRLSYYVNNQNQSEFERLIKKSTNFVLLLSISLSCFFVILAKPCILLLSGDGYIDATLAMQIIIPSIIFIGLSNITGMQIFTPLGRENIVLLSVVVGAIVDLVLNIIFIPIMEAAGASLGTLIAEISVLIVQIYFLKKVNFRILNGKNFLKIIISNLIASIVLVIFYNTVHLPVFIILVCSGIIFFGLEAFLLVLIKEEFINEQIIRLKSKFI